MNRANREIVFNKYGGKCAYCGCELEKGWHVDHIRAQAKSSYHIAEGFDTNHIDNLNPACPSCNINKHDFTVEQFRAAIHKYVESLNNYSVQYKLAKRFGLISETGNKVEFYFEAVADKEFKN